ncbi:hypothetical protein ASE75_06445 [Sphingomonas sp. Leaf17]|uniref:hypothetical protein n=1 Tax=Sphingomonas sp. Leaf17 TaxID=1735683 RepID=UPI0006F9593D|nr:hypothetical protein [Sphingomonas sp. Leaf17]KQM65864.1 hypothetical protein ASE75_06445 [Sphingomonas sp. Leaf17]
MSETPSERREAAATRRRWVTLAEVVAVIGVLIAGLTLWNNWSDRRNTAAEKAAEAQSESRARSRVDLKAAVEDGGRRLALSDAAHALQDVEVIFPAALGVADQRPSGDPVIDARWFQDALLKATDGGADDREGRLPVLLRVTYLDGDAIRTTTSLYDVVWRTEGRLLQGRALKLEGLRIRSRSGTTKALNAAWAREKPAA